MPGSIALRHSPPFMSVRKVVLSTLALTCLLPAGASADDRAKRPPPPPRMTGEMVIQQRLIIRIPRIPVGRVSMAAPAPAPPPIRWVEKRADACVPAIALAGAVVNGANSVDLVLNGGKRLRARLNDRCPALDFYSGFYLKMHSDGRVCADRDSIRSRSGGECRIRSFKSLVPAR
jgi:hypothetical protein